MMLPSSSIGSISLSSTTSECKSPFFWFPELTVRMKTGLEPIKKWVSVPHSPNSPYGDETVINNKFCTCTPKYVCTTGRYVGMFCTRITRVMCDVATSTPPHQSFCLHTIHPHIHLIHFQNNSVRFSFDCGQPCSRILHSILQKLFQIFPLNS